MIAMQIDFVSLCVIGPQLSTAKYGKEPRHTISILHDRSTGPYCCPLSPLRPWTSDPFSSGHDYGAFRQNRQIELAATYARRYGPRETACASCFLTSVGGQIHVLPFTYHEEAHDWLEKSRVG